VARGLAGCHRRRGDLAVAEELVSRGLSDQRPREVARAHHELAEILRSQGDLDAAVQKAELAADSSRAHGYVLDTARALRTAAELRSSLGDDEAARRLTAEAVHHLSEVDSDNPDRTEPAHVSRP
jgi:tetratricopeptide (TPR) repeat protein